MFGPRKRPTRYHSRPPSSRPPAGNSSRVYAHQAGPHTAPVGTQNSRLAMVPPGLSTRASSVSVACGSRTYLSR